MWVADMDFRTPDCIVDAMAKRLEHHAFGYFRMPQAYFDGIAKWQKERYGVDGVTADQVDYQNGVLGGVATALQAFTAPGLLSARRLAAPERYLLHWFPEHRC